MFSGQRRGQKRWVLLPFALTALLLASSLTADAQLTSIPGTAGEHLPLEANSTPRADPSKKNVYENIKLRSAVSYTSLCKAKHVQLGDKSFMSTYFTLENQKQFKCENE